MTTNNLLQEVNSVEFMLDLKDRLFNFVCYAVKNGSVTTSKPEARALEDALDVLYRLTSEN